VTVRVVIAEDEAIIRLDLKETLEEEGYEVVGETGPWATRRSSSCASTRPDIAILDIKMPGMDGLTAAKEISTDNLAAVLILTAFSQRDLIERARDAGALAYLVKPFQKSELIPAVEVALGRYKEMQALQAEVKGPRGPARHPPGRRPRPRASSWTPTSSRRRRVRLDPEDGDARAAHDEGRRAAHHRRGAPARPAGLTWPSSSCSTATR
jgi:AmiR/NasT family two-component response regulator